MSRSVFGCGLAGIAAALALLIPNHGACGQFEETFSYQGRLTSQGEPFGGAVDLAFRLYDAEMGGNQIGPELPFDDYLVSDGLITVELDFGPDIFLGSERWLEIDVDGITLAPRQLINACPYALFALAGNEGPQGPPGEDALWEVYGSTMYYTGGNVGIGESSPDYPLHVSSTADRTIFAENTAGSGTRYGVYATSSSTSGRAVYGFVGADTGTTYGLYGRSTSTSGRGVYGIAAAYSGSNYGVYGESNSPDGCGVYGVAQAESGENYGVCGRADGDEGCGVYGIATDSPGAVHGVCGETPSDEGHGVSGFATSTDEYGHGIGVYGQTDSPNGDGVHGYSSNGAVGVRGVSETSGGIGVYGKGNMWSVYGTIDTSNGTAVYGRASATMGSNYGVYGWTQSNSGTGVRGEVANSGGLNYGVWGATYSFAGYDFYAAGYGVNYGSPSSIRWKHNVEPIPDSLDMLAQLRGVYFNWDDDHGGHHDVGMVAEDVGRVLPEIVNYEENGIDANGMDYSKLTPLLVEAVNALRAEKDAEIAERDRRIEALQYTNAEFEARLARLEALVDELAAGQGEKR
jgi:hypothetical protein